MHITLKKRQQNYLKALKQNIKKNVNREKNGSMQIADIIFSELKDKGLIA